MLKPLHIESTRNIRYRDWKKLVDDSRARKKQLRYIVEGEKLVRDVLDSGSKVLVLAMDEKLAGKGSFKGLASIALARGGSFVTLAAGLAGSLLGSPASQGIMAIVEAPRPLDLASVDFKKDGMLVSCHGIQDPGNLGAILRSAAAAGADGALLDEACADPTSPKAVRASAGAVWMLPWLQQPKLIKTLEMLKKKKWQMLAAVAEQAYSYLECDFRSSFCLMVGAEGQGLPEDIKLFSKFHITVPLEKGIESLNAGHSAAVMLFEAARQRKGL